MAEDFELHSPMDSPAADQEPDSPSSPISDTKSDSSFNPSLEDKVYSNNHPESKAALILHGKKLWEQFDTVGTEMIVTRRGRRMFPPIKVELFDLEPDTSYVLLMDMAPVDKFRYKYQNSKWVKCFEEECSPTRLYIHPDSPALGSQWMNTIINFYKLKLTNNQLDKQGHIIVNSMHRYQPRLHIVEASDTNNLNWEKSYTFTYSGTQFITVTAYQNDKITQLKIDNNPFAKGFRGEFQRCRARNHTQRFSLRSNSESGPEELRGSPTLLPHHFLVPASAELRQNELAIGVGMKRKMEHDSEPHGLKQICLSEQGLVKVAAPQFIHNPISIPSSNGSAMSSVVILYKPVESSDVNRTAIFPHGPNSATLIPTSNGHFLNGANGATLIPTSNGHFLNGPNGATLIPTSNGHFLNGPNGATLIPTSNGHFLNGATVLQAQPISGDIQTIGGTSAATVLQTAIIPSQSGTMVQPQRLSVQTSQPTMLNTAAVIQANPALFNGSTVLKTTTGQPISVMQPRKICSGTATVVYSSTPTTMAVSQSKRRPNSPKVATPTIDISRLTKEGIQKVPPPLVEVYGEDKDSLYDRPIMDVGSFLNKSKTTETQISPASNATGSSIFVQASTAPMHPMQKVVILTEKADSCSPVFLSATEGDLKTQMVIPVAYDQQVVTSMPIYRFGGMNTLQPIQIVTPVMAPSAITTV